MRRHSLDRALLILGAAHPDAPYDTLADWPLGRRNRSIARLRCACFGRGIHGWIACPRCGDKLEFEVDAHTLAADDADRADDRPIRVGERAFRLPTTRDLAGITAQADPRLASLRLVENCLIEPDGTAAWSDDELEEIGDKMAQGDPLAETRLALDCPSCAHAWEESLDIAAFLWEEIDARARRILFEIHGLASAYGWSEAQILALSASRRAHYLELARA